MNTDAAAGDVVLRVVRDRDYSVISLHAMHDSALSFKAKGLHTYLVSRPDGWRFFMADLERRSTDGREAVQSGLKELEAAGYLQRKPARTDTGQVQGWTWYVHETPACEHTVQRVSRPTVEPPNGKPVGIVSSTGSKGNNMSVGNAPTWAEARAAYPPRLASHSWANGEKQWNARQRQGHTADAMYEGLLRYSDFLHATGKTSTERPGEYVMMAATFFGPGLHFTLPWEVPPTAAGGRQANGKAAAPPAEEDPEPWMRNVVAG